MRGSGVTGGRRHGKASKVRSVFGYFFWKCSLGVLGSVVGVHLGYLALRALVLNRESEWKTKCID